MRDPPSGFPEMALPSAGKANWLKPTPLGASRPSPIPIVLCKECGRELDKDASYDFPGRKQKVRKSRKTKDSQRAWNDENAHCSKGSNRSKVKTLQEARTRSSRSSSPAGPLTFEAPHCKPMALLGPSRSRSGWS